MGGGLGEGRAARFWEVVDLVAPGPLSGCPGLSLAAQGSYLAILDRLRLPFEPLRGIPVTCFVVFHVCRAIASEHAKKSQKVTLQISVRRVLVRARLKFSLFALFQNVFDFRLHFGVILGARSLWGALLWLSLAMFRRSLRPNWANMGPQVSQSRPRTSQRHPKWLPEAELTSGTPQVHLQRVA